jgi:hypothetical protein
VRRGNATTSQTRGRQCNSIQMDKRPMRGGNKRQWPNVRRGHATAIRDDSTGGRCNNQPRAGEAMEGGGCRVAG